MSASIAPFAHNTSPGSLPHTVRFLLPPPNLLLFPQNLLTIRATLSQICEIQLCTWHLSLSLAGWLSFGHLAFLKSLQAFGSEKVLLIACMCVYDFAFWLFEAEFSIGGKEKKLWLVKWINYSPPVYRWMSSFCFAREQHSRGLSLSLLFPLLLLWGCGHFHGDVRCNYAYYFHGWGDGILFAKFSVYLKFLSVVSRFEPGFIWEPLLGLLAGFLKMDCRDC